jgi:large subunit ribosomal protein L15
METLNSLSKTTKKQQKRVGRGYGSGVGGHTTGRGQKGDKVRGKTRITFDGTKIKKGWIKRTPFLRGKHRVLAKAILYTFNLNFLSKIYKEGEMVDFKSLSKKTGIYEQLLVNNCKVLATGKLDKALNFKDLLFSTKARELIIAAGGKID